MFIDAHSHILPNIDDGSPDLKTSLALARMAVEDGITHVVCTPHIHLGRFDNNPQTIADALAELRAGLQRENIPLKVAAAAELRVCSSILKLLKAKQIPFMGVWKRRKVLLLELPSDRVPKGTERLITWLLENGIQPLIAHPERNRELQQDFKQIQRLHQMGCLFQLTSSSIEGKFGPSAQRICEVMLQKNLAFMIATDAHNIEYRPPVISEALKLVKELVGVDRAMDLVCTHPFTVSRGMFSHYSFNA